MLFNMPKYNGLMMITPARMAKAVQIRACGTDAFLKHRYARERIGAYCETDRKLLLSRRTYHAAIAVAWRPGRERSEETSRRMGKMKNTANPLAPCRTACLHQVKHVIPNIFCLSGVNYVRIGRYSSVRYASCIKNGRDSEIKELEPVFSTSQICWENHPK